MRSLNAQLEQVQLLIDRIQNQDDYSVQFNKHNYEKLLTVSERSNYAYGQALAHVYLAKYYHSLQQDSAYYCHLDKARKIADSKNYFDVLIECYGLEALQNVDNCNDLIALPLYLNGIEIAMEIKDWKACADLNKHIAKLFHARGAYKDAEKFYIKALEYMDNITIQNIDPQRQMILMSLLHLSCTQKDLKAARGYYEKCLETTCQNGALSLLLEEGEIRILLLEQKEREARERVDPLVQSIQQSKKNDAFLKSAYFILIELLIQLKIQAHALWCMGEIEEWRQNAKQNMMLQIQKIHMQFADAFDCTSDDQYQEFYETTMRSEISHRQSTAESFKNLIALDKAEKEQKQMIEERTDLEIVVNTDELTRIYNRRYLNKLTSKLMHDEHVSSLGYVMIDVDFFKEYNDHYGHFKGDTALMEVASLLMDNLPNDAYAARYGGDEFSCLFMNKSEGEIIQFIKAVQQGLKNKNIVHSKSRNAQVLTLTFGIYNETELQNCSESELVKRADKALYQAKKSGRNTFAVYEKQEDSG